MLTCADSRDSLKHFYKQGPKWTILLVKVNNVGYTWHMDLKGQNKDPR